MREQSRFLYSASRVGKTRLIVNEINHFVYDILARRIITGLRKLKPQLLSSLTIYYGIFMRASSFQLR